MLNGISIAAGLCLRLAKFLCPPTEFRDAFLDACKPFDDAALVFGKNLGLDLGDAELASDSLRGNLVVASQHDHADALSLQPRDRVGRGGLDRVGNGEGMIVRRGFRPPPSLHIERLREAPLGHFFEVISRGFGAMPGYAEQVPTEDRWAMVAYIRALQLSQNATLADVPDAERRRLTEPQR